MTNSTASSVPNLSTEVEWERDYPACAYRASSLPFRAREDDTESYRLTQRLTSAAKVVYSMMAAGAIVELFLLGTLQQWW